MIKKVEDYLELEICQIDMDTIAPNTSKIKALL